MLHANILLNWVEAKDNIINNYLQCLYKNHVIKVKYEKMYAHGNLTRLVNR